MKNCSSCSKELAANAKFCPGCGSKQEALAPIVPEKQAVMEGITEDNEKGVKNSLLPYLVIFFTVLAGVFIYFFIPAGDGTKVASGRWKLVLEISSPDNGGKIRAQEFSKQLNSLGIIKTEVVRAPKGYLVVSEESFASKSDASAKMFNVDYMFSSSGIKLHTGEVISTENLK